MCEHCLGLHLRGMVPAETGKDLEAVAARVKASGGTGLLISGGCDIRGSVPVASFCGSIARIAATGLEINIHTGFIAEGEARRLVEAGVRRFSVDVHQDPSIIGSVLHLDVPPSAYGDTLSAISDAGGSPVPHLTVGFGTHDLVASAELVRDLGFKEVVLLVLVPTKGTSSEDASLPDEAVLSAVDLLAGMGLEVILGCMRDRSHRGLERRCIEHGVRRLANPSADTVEWCVSAGFEIVEDRRCCCMGLSEQ